MRRTSPVGIRGGPNAARRRQPLLTLLFALFSTLPATLPALGAGPVTATGLPGQVLAQRPGPDRYVPPPRGDETTLALGWMRGRFAMPITCLLSDGSRVRVEESVSIRPAPEVSPRTYKATFFGVDVAGAERCYTFTESALRDRRGVVFFTYRGYRRTDFGVRDFRSALADGGLEYSIQRGRLVLREIGPGGEAGPAEPEVIDFADGGTFVAQLLTPRSDGFRVLSQGPRGPVPDTDPRRRFEFVLRATNAQETRGFYLEAGRGGARDR